MKDSILYNLGKAYPQLLLPIRHGVKDTALYKAAVLRGERIDGRPDYLGSDRDSVTVEATPAGQVQVIFLEHRADFEHACRALAYRCEPVELLPSVGAMTVSGLINWEKIRRHQREWENAGGIDWQEELHRFAAVPGSCRDTLILLSSGDYSAVPAEEIQMLPGLWRERSMVIRKYHELTHVVCRRLWPERKNALRDEVHADCMGLLAAFGRYDPVLAERFLGIRDGVYTQGRLAHYVAGPEELPEAAELVRSYIARMGCLCTEYGGASFYDAMSSLYLQE